jgi:hypothetical protein
MMSVYVVRLERHIKPVTKVKRASDFIQMRKISKPQIPDPSNSFHQVTRPLLADAKRKVASWINRHPRQQPRVQHQAKKWQ